MNSKLYLISQENIETIIKFFEIINKKIKRYYSKVEKYKKYTIEYCSKVKQIFNEENIFNLNSSLEEFETIEIDLGLTNKDIKNKVNSSFSNTFKKKVNISPIIHSIRKINKFFNEYIHYIEIFSKSLDIPLKNLSQCIEVANNEIISVKNNHSTQQKTFLLKYNEFNSINRDLKNIYSEAEYKLYDYSLRKKSTNTKRLEKEKMENKLNASLTNRIEKQKNILIKYNNLNNFGKIFNDSTNQKINTIKDFTSGLFHKFELFLNEIYSYFGKSFMKPMNQLMNSKEKINNNEDVKIKNEFEELLNKYIKNVDEKYTQNKLDLYNIKLIGKNEEIKEEIYEDDNSKSSNSIELLKINKDLLEEEDIYFIIKNMYDKFIYINKSDYDLQNEEKKIIIKKIIDKLTSFGKIKRNSSLLESWDFLDEEEILEEKECDIENDENKINKNEDENEINKIEDENKNKIDKDENNINKDENNINKDENNINNKEVKNKISTKSKEITSQELEIICEFMKDKEYHKYFLMKINNFRTLGVFEMPLEIYNCMLKIFLEIANNLVVKTDEEKNEFDFDGDNAKLLIILSQTFYCLKNNEKNYLQKDLKNDNFSNTKFWYKLIIKCIQTELENLSKSSKKTNRPEDEKTIKYDRNNIAFAQTAPYIGLMKSFGIAPEEIIKTISPILDEYGVSEKNREILFSMINDSKDK